MGKVSCVENQGIRVQGAVLCDDLEGPRVSADFLAQSLPSGWGEREPRVGKKETNSDLGGIQKVEETNAKRKTNSEMKSERNEEMNRRGPQLWSTSSQSKR